MIYHSDKLDAILALIKQLESALLGLKELRRNVGKGAGLKALETLISEIEGSLAEVKRRLAQ